MTTSMIGLTLVLALADAPRARPDDGAFRPGWYRVTLSSGQEITVRISRQRGDVLDCQLEGNMLELRRSQLKSVEPLGAGGSTEDAELRDAVNDLAQIDKSTWQRARVRLRNAFPESRPLLYEALSHREARVRLLVVQILGQIGSAEKDGAKVARMLRDAQAAVRRGAIFATRDLGPFEEGKRALLDLAKRDSESNLKKAAIKTLERWNARELAGELVTRMEIEDDRGVRNFMGQALAFFLKADFGDDADAWRRHYDRVSGAESARIQHLTELMKAQGGAN